MNENLKGIDIGKLIAAILIVLLHAIECSDNFACAAKFTLTRFAVPFFFITSGYFLAMGLQKHPDNHGEYIRSYILKMAKIFTVWALLIYSPFVIHSYFTMPKYSDSSTITILAVLFRKFFIVGPGPYWFLLALIGGSLWVYILRKHTKALITGMLAAFSLLILYTCFKTQTEEVFLISQFYKINDILYSWEFNFILYGIPFCSLGFLFLKIKVNMPTTFSLIGFIIFTILRIIEWQFSSGLFSVCYIPQAVCFFMVMLNYRPAISNQTSRKLRSLSSFIYFSHAILLYDILNPILVLSGFNQTYAPIAIIPKALIITLACYILYAQISKCKSSFSKILING